MVGRIDGSKTRIQPCASTPYILTGLYVSTWSGSETGKKARAGGATELGLLKHVNVCSRCALHGRWRYGRKSDHRQSVDWNVVELPICLRANAALNWRLPMRDGRPEKRNGSKEWWLCGGGW